MKLTKSKLKKLIKEEIQLGKVYTFKDKPPFKTDEARDITPDGKWVVYNGDNDKTIKVVANRREATKLMNKLLNKLQPDYLNVGAKPLKEEKLTEAKASAEFYKGIQKWYGLASDLFPELEKTYKEAIKAKDIKNDKPFLEAFKDAVKYADLSFKQLDRIVKFMKQAGL